MPASTAALLSLAHIPTSSCVHLWVLRLSLAFPALDLVFAYDKCHCLMQPGSLSDLVLILTSNRYSLAGKYPQFPCYACSQPDVLYLPGVTEV